MLQNLFKRKNKYEKFWEWFEGFSPIMFEELQKEGFNQPMFGIMNSHISRIHPKLDFEFGIEDSIELVITANGIKEVMPEVFNLVKAAPSFQKWKITALKQRVEGDNYEIKYGDLVLGYNDIFFQYDDSEPQLGIQLNIKDYKKNAEYVNGTYRLLDALLGEYDVTYHIGFIEWEVLVADNKNQLLPFVRLRELIDKRKGLA